MSKISYCSLEEAWGASYTKNINDDISTNKDINKDINKNIDNIQNNNVLNDKYDYLNKTSNTERNNVIKNMNSVERNKTPENNSIVEYNKYRFNPVNKVNGNNNTDITYTPFNESIEKKYLQDKINFLENEFKKYKYLFDKNENSDSLNTIENFSNQEIKENNRSSKSNDIIDLFLLIIIGLIVIFVMNSIFSIGKSIGARK
jgi:hypothetical protein